MITKVEPQALHDAWDFTLRGLLTIQKKLGPKRVDWRPEDVYLSIRTGAADLYLITRGARRLGFLVIYVQLRPFSGKRELFIWAAWDLPLRERQAGDDVPEAVAKCREFIVSQMVERDCDSILTLSPRPGLKRFGFEPSLTTWRIWR